MLHTRLRRRAGLVARALFVAVLLAAVAVFAACGDDDDDPGDTTGSAGAGFPVTVTHKYGESKIEKQPARVVSVGYSEQDILLSLGIHPVGVRDWYGDYPGAIWPWAQAAAGKELPKIIGLAELDFEAIAALKPDVIIGITSGMTKEEYDKLSRIAPTVPQPGEFVDYGVPWRDEVRIIGKALGKDEAANKLISDIDARFAQIRKDHPEFQGKTAAVAFQFQDMPGAYSSQDVRSQMMKDLGFVIPPAFDQLAGKAFYFSVSAEQISTLDTDVIVWLASDDAGLDVVRKMPLRPQLKAVGQGREVFVGKLLGGAFSFASPLSINYLLDNLVPKLTAAVDGNPSTAVPQN
jgi:iron complex transport system substrate-binding protein